MSAKGIHSGDRAEDGIPLSVGVTFAATPTIIRLMKPTVMAWRVAP